MGGAPAAPPSILFKPVSSTTHTDKHNLKRHKLQFGMVLILAKNAPTTTDINYGFTYHHARTE